MQAVLVMFRSDGERRSFSVTRDMTVVGRREDCDLRIPLGEISRKHARLVRDGETLRLEDLGSSNGTFLNGQRVQEAILNPGDSIQIGPVVFVLQIDGYPADEDLHPVVAEMAEHGAAEPPPADAGPLSPTAQSELEDLGHLEPLPAHADAGLGLEPLPLDEVEPMPLQRPGPVHAASAPTANGNTETDLADLPELVDDGTLELLPDEPHHGGHDEPIDLDLGQQPHA